MSVHVCGAVFVLLACLSREPFRSRMAVPGFRYEFDLVLNALVARSPSGRQRHPVCLAILLWTWCFGVRGDLFSTRGGRWRVLREFGWWPTIVMAYQPFLLLPL